MKKKPVIIAVCVLIVVLVRLFTPYLGRPFILYCDHGERKGFILSTSIKKIDINSAYDPCLRFVKYCPKLEMIDVSGYSEKNLDHISNPNLKSIIISGDCANWSSLNKCTELEYLDILHGNFQTVEDISGLEKLRVLHIVAPASEFSLNKLNELKNLYWLQIVCDNDIDCEYFSQLEKLDSLDLSTYGKITGLDKLDSVTSLILHHPNEEVEKDICGMDSLRELKVYGTKFSDEVDIELEEKHVSVKYIE
ncbi:MAG: hypothetical protein K6F71_00940 [Ruminococcus sp.]|uniref:hypothetical protein n=1 Tax=Ruminococcus sp. TaxID=41978 RepID=UPI0025FB0539|nr:hypothetical protein [Ruminococcus sp.]MCR5539391.1 hypothetical protein [Ruminococcus sp.]